MHPAVLDGDALPPQAPRLLLSAVGGQLAVGTDDPPPGKPERRREDVPHRPGRPWVAGAARDLAIGQHLAALEVSDDGRHRVMK